MFGAVYQVHILWQKKKIQNTKLIFRESNVPCEQSRFDLSYNLEKIKATLLAGPRVKRKKFVPIFRRGYRYSFGVGVCTCVCVSGGGWEAGWVLFLVISVNSTLILHFCIQYFVYSKR